MKVGQRGAARRYARALLDVALDQGGAEALADDLGQAAALLAENAELHRALTHPGLPIERRRKVAADVFGGRGAHALLTRLVDMLIERGRLDLLPDVRDAFLAAWNDRRGVVTATAVTAGELSQAQVDRLAKALSAAAGRSVELTTAVDPGVLGGVKVTMGGRIYDGTVRGRLEALRHHLEGNR